MYKRNSTINPMFKNHTITKNTVKTTFDHWWNCFHKKTKQNKIDYTRALKLWDKTINTSLKQKAFKNIHKYVCKGLNGLEALRIELKLN